MNQNYGAVIDDNGNISSIRKDSSEIGFEEILKKENRLEVLNSRYKRKTEEYDNAIIDSKFAVAADTAVFVITAFGTIVSMGTSLPIMLLTSCGIYGVSKLMAVFAYGTRRSRKYKQEELTGEIKRLEREIEDTKSEILHDKDKVKFSKEVCMEVIDDAEILFNLDQIVSNEKEKVKVISLIRQR